MDYWKLYNHKFNIVKAVMHDFVTLKTSSSLFVSVCAGYLLANIPYLQATEVKQAIGTQVKQSALSNAA